MELGKILSLLCQVPNGEEWDQSKCTVSALKEGNTWETVEFQSFKHLEAKAVVQ